MIQQKVLPGQRKQMSAERILQWAFGFEKASLDPPRDKAGSSLGTGYRSNFDAFVEIALLGVRVDKSARGATYLADYAGHVHWDAESVAGLIRGMMDAGLMEARDAHALIDHARAGSRPSWMQGVAPRVIPRPHPDTPHDPDSGWKWTKKGRMGREELVPPAEVRRWPLVPGTAIDRKNLSATRWFDGGVRWKTFEHRFCPISFAPTKQEIATAREVYVRWWTALHKLREMLIEGNVLRSHEITREMPPAFPWLEEGEAGIVETGERLDWRNL